MNRRTFVAASASFAGIAIAPSFGVAQGGTPSNAIEAKFLFAVDGEKIKVLINGDESEIRLIGVDAPELKVDDDNTECFATESVSYLNELLTDQDVYLEADAEDKDNKDRLWRYVWADVDGDETMLNELVIANGFALVREEEKNIAYQDRLADAEKDAKDEKVGLWSDCANGHESIPRYGNKDKPGEWGETLVAEGVAVTPSDVFTEFTYNYSDAKGGYKYLIFQAYFENVGSSDEKGYSSGRFEATDLDTGADHKEVFLLLDQALGTGDLSFGSYVYGAVALEVQETATEFRIKYQVNGSGGPSLYWLVSI